MQTINRPKPFNDDDGPLSTKGGSVAAAIIAAVLAAVAIGFYLDRYRDNVNKDGVPTPVLVAEKLIEQGASGDTIGAQNLFKSSDVPRDQVKQGAIDDAAVLRGKVAVADILPGQQLTAADFKEAGTGTITKLAPDQRAMSVALNTAHGLLGTIRSGDHVDILSGFVVDGGTGRPRPFLRVLMQDVLVLAAPAEQKSGGVGGRGGANNTDEITLRVSDVQAPKLAFAADNGKVWVVLRPQNGGKVEKRTLVTLESLLFDAKPVRVRSGA